MKPKIVTPYTRAKLGAMNFAKYIFPYVHVNVPLIAYQEKYLILLFT